MRKELRRQIDVLQMYLKLILREELIGEVQRSAYVSQEIIEHKVIVTRCQDDLIKEIWHDDEKAYGQYHPSTDDSEQHPAQHIQMVPKTQFSFFYDLLYNTHSYRRFSLLAR